MEKEIRCPHCGQRERQNKQGKTKAESQKYLYRDCKRVYTPEPKRREYSEEIKRQAIKLYLKGNSGVVISRIFRNWAKKIKPKKVFNERVEVIEMDELYRFL